VRQVMEMRVRVWGMKRSFLAIPYKTEKLALIAHPLIAITR
jgi:hypothetical protein